ncbi:HupE/UreJ family protein [Chryseolinea soli]|uniref:HupE/UreJ family protein n=1 Tax=Chryseolinea soli TaxID=2321403 RepID=A0A385SGD6_9BACT|nr:HupE/UreJ family protein [Chryseolinea soli]AYB29994.1 HupE/UreJ family protein [Chryseolinea soli]
MGAHSCFSNRQRKNWRLPFLIAIFGISVLVPLKVHAHPSPNSILLLDVSSDRVVLEAHIPLPELALVLGDEIQRTPDVLTERFSSVLHAYFLEHVHAYVDKNHPWGVAIKQMSMDKGRYIDSNISYYEVVVQFVLLPNSGEGTRSFTLQYDAVMHQVVNHVALISIRRDWEAGIIHADTTKDVSVIGWNLSNNSIPPLQVTLDAGSWWKGIASMLGLGMQHIKEGTDHLLFLLTLLLSAPLTVKSRRWGNYGGLRYSLFNLLKVVSAFTIGHSLTLLVGALGWMHIPSQPVEILIAFSILISAVHAFRPVFAGKEIYIAMGFGLIHGLAFASILTDLNLDTGQMIWSILGFNIGIELMQIFVIVMTVPWLILLSRTPYYSGVRMGGAGFAVIASLAWIFERVSGTSAFISLMIEKFADNAAYGIGLLAIISLIVHFLNRPKVNVV